MRSKESKTLVNLTDYRSNMPQVSVDIEFQNGLAGGGSIGWDLDAITEHLHESGLTDEQIGRVRISLVPVFGKQYKDMNKSGGMNCVGLTRYDSGSKGAEAIIVADCESEANNTLFHEMQHIIDHYTIGVKALRHESLKDKDTKRLLAVEALLLSSIPVNLAIRANVWQSALSTGVILVAGIAAMKRKRYEDYRSGSAEERAFAAGDAHKDDQVITLEYPQGSYFDV